MNGLAVYKHPSTKEVEENSLKKEKDFIQFTEQYLSRSHRSERYKQMYRNTLSHVSQFCKHMGIDNPKTNDIDISFCEDYVHFLRTENNLMQNTVKGSLERIHAILHKAALYGYPVNNTYQEITIPEEEVGSVEEEGEDSQTANDIIKYLAVDDNFARLLTFEFGKGYSSTGAEVTSVSRTALKRYKAIENIVFQTSDNVTVERVVIFSEEGEVLEVRSASNNSIPKGTIFGLSIINRNEFVLTPSNIYDNVFIRKVVSSGASWLALGDSITAGTYTIIEEGLPVSHTNMELTWVSHVRDSKGYSLTNRGEGG